MKLKPSFNVSTSSLSLPTPVLPTLKPLLQLNLGDASPFSSSNLNSLLEESSSESGRYRTKAAQSTTRIRSEGYYEDTIARTELSNARAIRLIRESCLVILSRGSSVLGIFKPYRISESLSKLHRLATLFLALNKGKVAGEDDVDLPWIRKDDESFIEELRNANIHDVVALFKFALSHLSSFTSTPSSDPFHWFQPTSPPQSFADLISTLPIESRTLLLEVLKLSEVLLAKTGENALTAEKWSKVLGYSLFTPSFSSTSFIPTPDQRYALWTRSSEIFFDCLTSYLRSQSMRLPLRLEELLNVSSLTARENRRIRVLRIDLRTDGGTIGRRKPGELLTLAIKAGVKQRKERVVVADEEQVIPRLIWGAVLEATTANKDGEREELEKQWRRVVLSEETNRVLDLVETESNRLYDIAFPPVVVVPAEIKRVTLPTIDSRDWSDFSSIGFDGATSTPLSPIDEFGLINPLTSSMNLLSLLAPPPTLPLSTLSRLSSTLRRSSSVYGNTEPVPRISSARPLRIKAKTSIMSVRIDELDSDYLDFWLDSLTAPRTSPMDILAPFETTLLRSINESSPSPVTCVYITESSIDFTVALSSIRSPSLPVPTPIRSSASSTISTTPESIPSPTAEPVMPVVRLHLHRVKISDISEPIPILESLTSSAVLNAVPIVRPVLTSTQQKVVSASPSSSVGVVKSSVISAPAPTKVKKDKKGLFSWFKSSNKSTSSASPPVPPKETPVLRAPPSPPKDRTGVRVPPPERVIVPALIVSAVVTEVVESSSIAVPDEEEVEAAEEERIVREEDPSVDEITVPVVAVEVPAAEEVAREDATVVESMPTLAASTPEDLPAPIVDSTLEDVARVSADSEIYSDQGISETMSSLDQFADSPEMVEESSSVTADLSSTFEEESSMLETIDTQQETLDVGVLEMQDEFLHHSRYSLMSVVDECHYDDNESVDSDPFAAGEPLAGSIYSAPTASTQSLTSSQSHRSISSITSSPVRFSTIQRYSPPSPTSPTFADLSSDSLEPPRSLGHKFSVKGLLSRARKQSLPPPTIETPKIVRSVKARVGEIDAVSAQETRLTEDRGLSSSFSLGDLVVSTLRETSPLSTFESRRMSSISTTSTLLPPRPSTDTARSGMKTCEE